MHRPTRPVDGFDLVGGKPSAPQLATTASSTVSPLKSPGVTPAARGIALDRPHLFSTPHAVKLPVHREREYFRTLMSRFRDGWEVKSLGERTAQCGSASLATIAFQPKWRDWGRTGATITRLVTRTSCAHLRPKSR